MGRGAKCFSKGQSLLGKFIDIGSLGGMLGENRISTLVIGHDDENVGRLHWMSLK